MFAMFKQIFASIETLFSAFNKVAKTVDNLASVGEETSGTYLDRTRIERQANLNTMQKESGVKLISK